MKLLQVLFIIFSSFAFSQDITDSDGDGILDKQDKCPVAYGSIKLEGCPEITESIISENRLKHEKQFEEFKRSYKFSDLSKLVISKINLTHFDKEIIMISFKNEMMSTQDVGPIKPEIISDREALNNNILNNVWNEDNFSAFLKNNPGKKIILMESFDSPTGFSVEDFSNIESFLNTYKSGTITINDSYNNIKTSVPYYTHGIKNKDISFTNNEDLHHGYSAIFFKSSFYEGTLSMTYVYNFKLLTGKSFTYKKGIWKYNKPH